jgi:hypothetical protein
MNNNTIFDPIAWAAASENNSKSANNVNDQMITGQVQNPQPAVPFVGNELDKAKATVVELLRLGANIAESYDDWWECGCALAELGPEARDLFHQVSSQSTKYREADCEKKWQECLSKRDGRITIATFYKMAQMAGVDLSAIGRQFPSTPPLRHDSSNEFIGSKESVSGNMQMTVGNNINGYKAPGVQSSFTAVQSGGGMAEMAEVSSQNVEQILDASALINPTFSDKLDINNLPPIIRDAAQSQTTFEGRDKVILSMLNLASGFSPNVCGIYDRRLVFPPFYNFVVAPSGADKGIIPACLALVEPIKLEIRSRYEAAHREYIKKKAAYDALSKKEKVNATEPEEPPYRSPIISVNASATAFYQDLAANDGWGAIFETEADTLTQAIKQDYGDYSSGLRKAFHHETIDYSRRKDNEHVYVDKPRMSILLTCTPGQVPLLLSPQNTENGLANRFVFYLLRKSRGWRNVFEDCEETLSEQMAPLGLRFKAIYDDLQAFGKEPLKFTLNEEQKIRFNQFFEPLYNEQVGLHGDELDAFVFRLGLTTYRIAMVLTILRHEEQQPRFSQQGEPLVCTENDFQTAITIASCLINHTVFVYKRLLPHTEAPLSASGKPMSPQELAFLNTLPQEFTRKEFLMVARQLQMSERTAERYVGAFISDYNVVIRISTGHYRKR